MKTKLSLLLCVVLLLSGCAALTLDKDDLVGGAPSKSPDNFKTNSTINHDRAYPKTAESRN